MRFGYIGTGYYFVADGEKYLGAVAKTSRRWEAWRGHEGINVGLEFKTRRDAGAHLLALATEGGPAAAGHEARSAE